MLRQGHGTPLVLLHGILGSETMWRDVLPLVAAHHDTIAPTALGHRGGRPSAGIPVGIGDVIDDAQRVLDDLRLDRAHLAGNSMGGWVALELARRGRALSVCALSPAGFWAQHGHGRRRATGLLRATIRNARRGRWALPVLARSARFRAWAMRLIAVHGDRLARKDVIELTDDLLACTIAADLLSAQAGDALAPFERLPCPVTLAWSEQDRIFPLSTTGAYARTLVPEAKFVELKGVGHVPMLDAPDLVARTVLECTGARTATVEIRDTIGSDVPIRTKF